MQLKFLKILKSIIRSLVYIVVCDVVCLELLPRKSILRSLADVRFKWPNTMPTSGSESDSDEYSLASSTADKLLTRVPDYIKRTKSRKKLFEIRSLLPKGKPDDCTKKSSSRIDNNKKMEDVLKDIRADFTKILSKFDHLYSLIPAIVDSLDMFEERVSKLEEELFEFKSASSKTSIPSPTPYRDALASNDSERLNKLEFFNSEEERKKRSLEVCFTHPNIQTSSVNVSEQLGSLLRDTLKLESHQFDANLRVRKSKRDNTVIVTFSHQRFKSFAYRARKKLRVEGEDVVDLYLNDNLTSYNHKILMELKKKRKIFARSDDPFSTIYSFEGKVFAKLKRDLNMDSIHIKNNNQLERFLVEIGNGSSAAALATHTQDA